MCCFDLDDVLLISITFSQIFFRRHPRNVHHFILSMNVTTGGGTLPPARAEIASPDVSLIVSKPCVLRVVETFSLLCHS